jgi:flagellar hook-associated protein 3 FlgL
MTTRIATGAANARMTADLARAFSALTRKQNQISSGKRLTKPSDGPAEVATALNGRATARRMEQFATSASDALGWLRVSDSTLVSAQENLTRARTAAVQVVNGALSAVDREAVALEIDNIRNGLVQEANTTYQNRAVFAGTAAVGSAPFAASGDYTGGNAGAVSRVVAEGVSLQVNVIGPDVFGAYNATDPANGNLFQVLDTLAAAIRAGDETGVGTSLKSLSAASDRMSSAQVRIGGLSNQVEEILYRNETMLLDVKERLSAVEDTDVAEAIIGLRTSESAYQAALAVTAKVVQPSLLDFLR